MDSRDKRFLTPGSYFPLPCVSLLHLWRNLFGLYLFFSGDFFHTKLYFLSYFFPLSLDRKRTVPLEIVLILLSLPCHFSWMNDFWALTSIPILFSLLIITSFQILFSFLCHFTSRSSLLYLISVDKIIFKFLFFLYLRNGIRIWIQKSSRPH